MRLIVLSIFILLNSVGLAIDFEKVPLSTSFYKVSGDATLRSDFLEYLESMKTRDALTSAYLGAAKALMADVESNPYSSYQYFKSGSSLIDEAVMSSPKSAEIRYVRFMIQINSPDFLGYSDNIEEDFQQIKAEINAANQKETWMIDFIQYLTNFNTDYEL